MSINIRMDKFWYIYTDSIKMNEVVTYDNLDDSKKHKQDKEYI